MRRREGPPVDRRLEAEPQPERAGENAGFTTGAQRRPVHPPTKKSRAARFPERRGKVFEDL